MSYCGGYHDSSCELMRDLVKRDRVPTRLVLSMPSMPMHVLVAVLNILFDLLHSTGVLLTARSSNFWSV